MFRGMRAVTMKSALAIAALLAFVSCTVTASRHSSAGATRDGRPGTRDWLIDGSGYTARCVHDPLSEHLVLENGLVRREWRLGSAGACIGFDDLVGDRSLIRSVRPEARVRIDGKEHAVGGLIGQPDHAYLTPAWLREMRPDPEAFVFTGFTTGEPLERVGWKRVRHASPAAQWPPRGVHLRLSYELADEGNGALEVDVHYELYDGVPVFSKWIEVRNQKAHTIRLDSFRLEELALVEHVNWVEARDGVDLPRPEVLHLETDFAFGGFNHENANRHTVHWRTDPLYTSQVNYLKHDPSLLVVEPTHGPAQDILASASFESFRAFELVHASTERERRGLALRRMYRTIAPWVTENPIMHHLRVSDPESVRRAIDDAAEVGFEMVILSFGSGFDMESEDAEYIAGWERLANYAEERGVELGGYSLFSSRKIGDGNDIVSPAGLRPTHGNCPAVTSEWGLAYYTKLYRFFERTGFDLLEHDGPYPGDVDVTSRPPFQEGESDSRWVQWRIVADFYSWLRERGVYLNAPDYYFLVGSSKCGMGYREVNWSLPRAQQVIHTRQNIFDGTWKKTPSMGWMFVPLSEYHGGGAAATIEPLDEHRDHYRAMLESNLALGVQACYRGPRLFDTQRTKALVQESVAWFKRYRDILESDVVHGRRADGRDLDWMLHVNPGLEDKGMLVVFNPLEEALTRTLKVDLYYTGLRDVASVTSAAGMTTRFELDRDYGIELEVTIAAGGMGWYAIR